MNRATWMIGLAVGMLGVPHGVLAASIYDFQQANAGTKPVVAIQKYHESLGPQRTEGDIVSKGLEMPFKGAGLVFSTGWGAVTKGVNVVLDLAQLKTTPAMRSNKTLADFQRANSGTKPVVAIHKYHEYLSRTTAK